MNSKAANELSQHRLSEITKFAGNILTFLSANSAARDVRGHGFSTVMQRVMDDGMVWKAACKLIGEVKKPPTNFVVDLVARLQMQPGPRGTRERFGRATSERYSVPTAELLTHLLQKHDGDIQLLQAELKVLREEHVRLVSDPGGWVQLGIGADLNDYIRIAMRSFYVLSAIPSSDVRCKHVCYSCSCPHFRLRSYCKHCIALTHQLNGTAIPAEQNYAKVTKLANRGRRKRGYKKAHQLKSYTDNVCVTGRRPEGHDGGSDDDDEARGDYRDSDGEGEGFGSQDDSA
jgi:hypothetical protein